MVVSDSNNGPKARQSKARQRLPKSISIGTF